MLLTALPSSKAAKSIGTFKLRKRLVGPQLHSKLLTTPPQENDEGRFLVPTPSFSILCVFPICHRKEKVLCLPNHQDTFTNSGKTGIHFRRLLRCSSLYYSSLALCAGGPKSSLYLRAPVFFFFFLKSRT